MTLLIDRIRANDVELKELSLISSPANYFEDAYELLEALSHNTHVESVRLDGAFLEGLSLTQSSNFVARLSSSIKKVCLSGGRVPVRLVAELVENARNLNVLAVRDVELEGKEGDFSAFEVSLFRHRKLREFIMVDFTLVDTNLDAIDHLFQVLALIPTLAVVQLEADVTASNAPHHLDGESVAGLVSRSKTLKELRVSKFLIKPRDVKRVVKAVKGSASLEVLALKRVGMDDADAAQIAQVLLKDDARCCCCLRELDLSMNDIGDEGCLALAKSLLQRNNNNKRRRNHHQLRTLRLTGNKKIGLEGIAAMADVMNHNDTLQNLEMSSAIPSQYNGRTRRGSSQAVAKRSSRAAVAA